LGKGNYHCRSHSLDGNKGNKENGQSHYSKVNENEKMLFKQNSQAEGQVYNNVRRLEIKNSQTTHNINELNKFTKTRFQRPDSLIQISNKNIPLDCNNIQNE